MDYCLLFIIAGACILHVLEHWLTSCRRWLAVINVAYHILSFFGFLWLGYELLDVCVFFLSSCVLALGLTLREVKDGI